MALLDGRKSSQIGLAVLIKYRSVTDTQPASQTRCRSYYRVYCVAKVKTDKNATAGLLNSQRPKAVSSDVVKAQLRVIRKQNTWKKTKKNIKRRRRECQIKQNKK